MGGCTRWRHGGAHHRRRCVPRSPGRNGLGRWTVTDTGRPLLRLSPRGIRRQCGERLLSPRAAPRAVRTLRSVVSCSLPSVRPSQRGGTGVAAPLTPRLMHWPTSLPVPQREAPSLSPWSPAITRAERGHAPKRSAPRELRASCTRAMIRVRTRRGGLLGCARPGGGGAGGVRAAGVEVIGGVLREEAQTLLGEWLFAAQHGRPRVTLKWAM